MKNKISWIWMFVVVVSAVSCERETKNKSTSESGVTGSEWFSPVSDKGNLWKELHYSAGGKYFRTEWSAPDLTQEALDKNIVLVYANFAGYDLWPGGHIDNLPMKVITRFSDTVEAEDNWSISLSPGTISIRLENSISYYPSAGGPNPGHSFRYIVVPKYAPTTGQKPTSINPLSIMSEKEMRDLSYDELCRMTGLKK